MRDKRIIELETKYYSIMNNPDSTLEQRISANFTMASVWMAEDLVKGRKKQ